MAELIADLAARLGVPRFVAVCTDLMAGADREEYVEELRGLTGHDWHPGDGVLDRDAWQDYWVRTWGARGLLHVWDDVATDAVVRGLARRALAAGRDVSQGRREARRCGHRRRCGRAR